jgi:predicted SAM-dependent methyltransferase
LILPYYRTKAQLGQYDDAKLNLGAGTTYLNNWINIDGNILRRPGMWLELRNKWPFRSNSVSCIATSHLLEHLFDHELSHCLKEIFRVLKHEGHLHISVPSLEIAVRNYVSGEWTGDEFNRNCCLHGGHRQIFDYERLKSILQNMGFIGLKKLDYLSSGFLTREELKEIDRSPEKSLFVECVKPPRQAPAGDKGL